MLVERTGAGYDGPRGGQQKSRGSDGNRGPWAAHLTPGWERDSLLPHTAGPPHGQKQAKKNEFIPESCSTCAGNVKPEVPRFRRSRSVRRTVRRRLQQRGAVLPRALLELALLKGGVGMLPWRWPVDRSARHSLCLRAIRNRPW